MRRKSSFENGSKKGGVLKNDRKIDSILSIHRQDRIIDKMRLRYLREVFGSYDHSYVFVVLPMKSFSDDIRRKQYEFGKIGIAISKRGTSMCICNLKRGRKVEGENKLGASAINTYIDEFLLCYVYMNVPSRLL